MSSCLKKARTDEESILFVGAESYFKYLDDVVPNVFIDVFRKNVKYDYLNLYNVSFMATQLESQYRLDQSLLIPYEDPYAKTPFMAIEEVPISSKLRLYNQNNCIISMEMVFDTLLPTIEDGISYHYYERYYADTMYVVGEVGSTGRFMMYGVTDCHVETSRVNENGYIVDGDYWDYDYTAWTIVVGDKVDNGIKDISYFECVAKDDDSYYPTGSIRAISDKDGLSKFYK